MRISIIVLCCFMKIKVASQFNFSYKDSIPVSVFGQQLKYPWSGGINNAQFSSIDFDFDNDEDLLILDRSADQIRLFENIGGSYKSYPHAASLFPNDIRYRLTAVDYNLDGRNDLFTYGIGGIKVYKNVGNAINGLQWELAKNLLYSDNWGANLNLYVSSSDIPAIVDVDNDGDIDVLTYHISGEYLQYHKNLSQELYGHSDSLKFELKNECWGGFREDVNSNLVFLNDQTLPCQSGNVPNPQFKPTEHVKAHSGSTVLALDYDGSGVKDLILGDVAHPNLILLLNGGSSVNSNSLMISQDPNFPSNSIPATMQLFPAAFWIDVDFDEKNDLIVAPNAKNVSENETSCMKFKNSGTNLNSNFIFETRAFLQEDMIEHGTGSVPIFSDLDNDGLLDLFIATFYAYKPTLLKESRIAYYKNIGSVTQPEFTLVDKDFLNLSASPYGLRMIPTFGDLNGDGKKDMLIGFENGSVGYFENNSTGTSISFANPILNLTDVNGNLISAGQYASPQLFDLNKDGKLDLILGKKTGELMYFEHTGQTSTSFLLKNSSLGLIDVATDTPDGYLVPHFFDHADTTYLLTGAADGNIYFFRNITDSLEEGQQFELIASDFLALSRDIGSYSAPFVCDIDNDSKLDLFLGQDAGGIFHLENSESDGVGLEASYINDLTVYPNPFSDILTISMDRDADIDVINSFGEKVFSTKLTGGKNTWITPALPAGLYFIKESSSSKVVKVVKF